jgi:hypothetical protein
MHGLGCMNPSSGVFMVQRRVGDYLFAQKGQVGVVFIGWYCDCFVFSQGGSLDISRFQSFAGSSISITHYR